MPEPTTLEDELRRQLWLAAFSDEEIERLLPKLIDAATKLAIVNGPGATTLGAAEQLIGILKAQRNRAAANAIASLTNAEEAGEC